ncbi:MULTISPECIES: YihY/virulence factor BrkB family protein [Thermoactinomyces]|uniref:YihY/virulence factor BrkB family protein n=1 Tax=Thermoactinomyces daqus TaxID=1329516 RepID=A0A7W2AHH5_9BACL|nr:MULTISPECIES: YihY/virulence factor BrkB family protein [Thermoactinomyces]MBA4542175.1 YihY/virulence factor BrkB family protein [Thermoactinomyces daqus]MBH8599019.1 YihY/virulence factor BrkB family protein [Thermoactinomyces sp. CICC 10523]MBH8605006.1 YihY/virulence factor BrkB family protein [Thermoactinomyces sp. CICC 10522]MBH8608446.1 YihY/virulence factor BrkB family protein [Thermoactinomyces sp. CICC 10521]
MFILFLKILRKRIWEDGIFDLAAQLAYYFLMSLFPFLLLAVTMLGFLPFRSDNILGMIKPYAPAGTYQLIASNLTSILDQQNSGIFSVSLIVTIYLASVAFRSIIRILDNAYRVHVERTFWSEFIIGFFLMFSLLVALIVSLTLPIFGKILGEFVFSLFGVEKWFLEFWVWVRWLLSTLVLFSVFWNLYKWAPHIRVSFRQALPGAVFATLGWQISSYGFSFYVSINQNYSHIYGNLGAIIVLVGWFYLSAVVLVLGGLINATWYQVKLGRAVTETGEKVY